MKAIKVEVTKACQESCKHCRFSRLYSNDQKHLSLKSLKEVITKSQKSKELSKSFSVMLTGGEPLLNPELFDMISYLRSVGGKHITIATNALPLYNNLELMKKLTLSKVDEIVISLSSSNEDYQNLRSSNQDIVLNQIQQIKIHNPKTRLTGNFLLHKNSINESEELIRNLSHNSLLAKTFNLIRFLSYDETQSPKSSPLKQLSQEEENHFELLTNTHNKKALGFISKIKNLITQALFKKSIIPVLLLKVENDTYEKNYIFISP